MFLGQYLSCLIQKTITYLKLSYSDLAVTTFIPEMVLRDAVERKMALTRGQWIKLGHLLDLPTAYELRAAERDGLACWEVCPQWSPQNRPSLTMSPPVKHFLSAVLRALWEARHFALAEKISIAIATKARL
jgi:hypothetical protein